MQDIILAPDVIALAYVGILSVTLINNILSSYRIIVSCVLTRCHDSVTSVIDEQLAKFRVVYAVAFIWHGAMSCCLRKQRCTLPKRMTVVCTE